MMVKHTKGEWSFNKWIQKAGDITIGAIGTPLIAIIPLRDVSINEQKYNAALVCAAPDMLLALKDAHAHIGDDALRTRIGQLIIKASGESDNG